MEINKEMLRVVLRGLLAAEKELEVKLDEIKKNISLVQEEISGQKGRGTDEPNPARTKRFISAKGRKAMAAAQKRRWAAKKAPKVEAKVEKKKRTMSAEGRASVAAGQRARWAKVKGKKAPKAKATKRKMSAAGREAISNAAKRMHAAKKAGKVTAISQAAIA